MDMNNWGKIRGISESEKCSMRTKQITKQISKDIYKDLQLGEQAQKCLWLVLEM